MAQAKTSNAGISNAKPVLQVKGLTVRNLARNAILSEVTLEIRAGEIFGVLGESSVGKTTLAKSILGILPESLYVERGEIRFDGKNLLDLSQKQMESIWGRGISYLPQNAGAALNPVFKLKTQIYDLARRRSNQKRTQDKWVLSALKQVYLPDDEAFLNKYPFQLSGGQQQRFLMAELLVVQPQVLIADEPTASLDASVQQEIVQLLRHVRDSFGLSILFITHDLAILSEIADRSCVLFDGKIVEIQKTEKLIKNPQHDYTKKLVHLSKRLSILHSETAKESS